MSLVTRSLVGLVLNSAHPTPDPIHCIDHRQLRATCTACADICPQKLFAKPCTVPDWTACTNCGLCVSACGSRCIAPAESTLEKQLELLQKAPKKLWLGCTAAKRTNDLSADCLAAWPWEYLAALSQNTALVLDLSPCAECESPCAPLLVQNLNRLAAYWGADFSAHILADYSGDPVPEHNEELDRRRLLKNALSGGFKLAGKLTQQLPGFSAEKQSGLLYRLVLHTQMQQSPHTQHAWAIPLFTEKCWGCGVCETLCPQKALRFLPQPDGTVTVAFSPWKCTDCGLCATLCPEKAIQGSRAVPLEDLSPVAVFHIQPVLCRLCGRAIRPGSPHGVCPGCLQKLKRRPGGLRDEPSVK